MTGYRWRSSRAAVAAVPLLILALICLAVPADAAWRELKPIFGGPVHQIGVDAGGTVYVAGPGGLLKSTDGGTTWQQATADLPTTVIYVIVPDPVAAGVVYVSTDQGLFRTVDGAASWTQIPLNLPSTVRVQQLAIAPADTDYLYVASWGSYAWRSQDGGATWQQSTAGLSGGWSGPSYLVAMNVDPTNENRVYTSTWRGRLFRSDDAAATWYQIGVGGGAWANGQIEVSRSSPNVLYTTHDEYWFGRGTVLKSTDYGTSWAAVARPTGHSATYRLAIDPTDSDIVYAVTDQGIYKTTNGGGSWTRVFFPPTGPTTMASVGLDLANPSRVYAGASYSGFYRSLDAGATWSQHNDGLSMAQLTGLELCLADPAVIYFGALGEGFFRSADGGDSWSLIGTAQGLHTHAPSDVAVHPSDPDLIVVGSYDGSVSRLWRSTDGGATFTVTRNQGAGSLGFNPLDPAYVHGRLGDSAGAFLRSTDAGLTWSVPQWWYRYPTNFTFHPQYPNVVFNATNRYIGSAYHRLSVFYSNDNASSWTETGIGNGDVYASALDANDPTILYVAARMTNEGTLGIYKFTVGYSGSSVTSVTRVPGTFNSGLGSTTVRGLAYDAANGYLYASTPLGVFRSADQAGTWTSINDGLPYRSTRHLAVTPDGSRLLVGTSGGVWEYTEGPPDALNVPDGQQTAYTTSGSLEQVVDVEPGDVCTLSLWVGKRSDGAGTWGRWYVQLTTGGWSIQNVLNGSLAAQSDEWAWYQTTFTVGSFPNLPIKLRLKGQWGFEVYDQVTLDCGSGDLVTHGSFEGPECPEGEWTTFGNPAPDGWTCVGGGAGLFNPNTTQMNDFF